MLIAQNPKSSAPLSHSPHNARATTTSSSPLASALDKTANSLASTLDRLATSLDQHSRRGSAAGNGDDGRYFVDIKLHTEAIKDVLDVLARVKAVQ